MTSSASKTAMAGPDRAPRRRTVRGLPLAALVLVGITACTPALPPPQTPPPKPEPVPSEAPASEEDPLSVAPATPAAPSSRVRDATLIVIDSGEPDSSTRPSLVEASKREKERKARAGKSVAVITDETLPKLAKKGQITFADISKSKRASEPPPPDTASVEQGQYWSQRARGIRERWRAAFDEGIALERQAAELRRRFYAESDPFRRDGEIKPNWDRTLDRLRLAKERADATQKELSDFLEEGRRSGALPGWLREGAELEPSPPTPPKSTTEAIEPPELKPKDLM